MDDVIAAAKLQHASQRLKAQIGIAAMIAAAMDAKMVHVAQFW